MNRYKKELPTLKKKAKKGLLDTRILCALSYIDFVSYCKKADYENKYKGSLKKEHNEN